MVVFYIIIGLLCLWGLKWRKSDDPDYLSKGQGDAVKGIFILIVILHHANSYIIDAGYAYTGLLDSLYKIVEDRFGQLIVVMFMFFSGYGVMSGIHGKGDGYLRAFPRHRLLGTLLNFDMAVVCYALMGLLIGKVYSAGTYLQALVAWESIGNSNWYIFAILLLYGFSWISARITKSGWRQLLITVALTAFLYVILLQFKENHWYVTLVTYPLGMLAFLCKKQLDSIGKVTYWCALAIGFTCLALTYMRHQDPYGLVYTFRAAVFNVVMVLLLMKFRVGNVALDWCGRNLFPLYLFHRFPMILLAHFDPFGITAGAPLLFVLTGFALTCPLVLLFNKVRIRI